MASPNSYNDRRTPSSLAREPPPVSASQSKRNCGANGFLCKSVFIAVFLVALPLIPSQAPDFVEGTVLTKFWELIYLLIVGIAVSYGLFSRRNVDLRVDLQTNDVDESPLSYVSRLFHVSSFSDYECEVDERDENRPIKVSVQTSIYNEGNKSGSFVVDSQLEDSFEYGKTNEIQTWNSQYIQGRSKVLVAQPSYALIYYTGNKSLGLPVRSLRSSALRDTQAPDCNYFSGSYDGAVSGELGSFGDSLELEEMEKTDDARALSSSVPRQSRSERMEMRDNLTGGAYPSNYRPPSVDEAQFEALESRSFRSTTSSSSQSSFISHNQSRLPPSHSISADSSSSDMEELVKEQSLHESSQSSSPSLNSSPSPMLVTDRHVLSHARHYSDGSLLEEEVRRGFEEEVERGTLRDRTTDFLTRGKLGSRSLKMTTGDFQERGSSRRCYPLDPISPPTGGVHSPTSWQSQQKSYGRLVENTNGKRWEREPNNHGGKLRSNSLKRRGGNQGTLVMGAEECDKDEKLRVSSPQSAPSPPMGDRLGGYGSLLDKDVKRYSEEEDYTDVGRPRRRDLSGNAANFQWESKHKKTANQVSLRGKSVRTVRCGRYSKDIDSTGESSDGWTEESEVEHLVRTKSRSQRHNDLSKEDQIRSAHVKAKPGWFDDERGKQFSKNYIMRERDDLEQEDNEAEEPQEEKGGRRSVGGGHESSEVDRKAGEFIAKFREQIRLQKLSSGEQPRH